MTLSDFIKEKWKGKAGEEYRKRYPIYEATANLVEGWIKTYLRLLCKTRPEEYFEVFDRTEYHPESRASVPLVYSRPKSFDSICQNVYFREVDEDKIYEELPDLAAARIICHYLPQIDYLHDSMVFGHLVKKYPIEVEKDGIQDYIKKPKESGYRSLHMVLLVSSPGIENSEKVRCELQIRTDIQDAWAEKEHQLVYKNSRFKKARQDNPEVTSGILRMSSAAMGILHGVDEQLQAIRKMVKHLIKDIHV